MTVRKKVWIILAAIALVVALAIMASNYFEAVAEHRALEGRLTTAQTRIPTLAAEKADLEEQERLAMSALETSQAKFPRAIESIEYGEDLFALAAASNVRITRLNTGSPGSSEVAGITYSTSSVLIVLEGEVRDILGFAHALRNPRDFQLPWSAEITGVNVDYATARASINLRVYGYKR